MTIAEATKHIAEILDEERASPTVSYKFVGAVPPWLEAFAPDFLGPERMHESRTVHETTSPYKFSSVNYDLLLALISRFAESERKQLIFSLLARVPDIRSCRISRSRSTYPIWNKFVSELPLIAEFCVRMGECERLFRIVAEAQPSPGLVLLLMQVEDMLAFRWSAFTKDQLEMVPLSLSSVRMVAQRYFDENTMTPSASWFESGGVVSLAALGAKVVGLCVSISEQCRKAKYFHLKGALLETSNLEVNQDKVAVESHLKQLGFSATLVQSLNHAEDLYRSPSHLISRAVWAT
jgi:hypothetical protein